MTSEDELEIRNLVARVARMTDQWTQLQDLTAEYTEDCEWVLRGVPPYRGRKGIAQRMTEMRDAGICGPGTAMRHIVSTPEVIADAKCPDRATVISFVMMGDMKDGRAVVAGYGQYTDSVCKQGGRWYMAKREGVAFW